MSLIFGVNLSDRIYLAADTRVTHLGSSHEPSWVADRVLKIEVLTEDVAVACAGDVVLIKYLFGKLRKEPFVQKGIEYLRTNIKVWVAEQINKYLENGRPYKKACFIFAGIDRKKRKVIDGKKLIDLVKELDSIKRQLPPPPQYLNDVIFQGLSAKPNVPNPKPELPVADSKLFAVMTDARNFYLEIQDAEWGEYLIYGPKEFERKRIPPAIFGRLEFEAGPGGFGAAQSILTAFVSNIEETQKLLTVGGSIIPFVISEKTGVCVMTGKVWRRKLDSSVPELVSDTSLVNGKISYGDGNGKYKPLTPISEYLPPKAEYSI